MIEVKNLTKRYGSNTAVNNISFTVSDGEILGFLGPNGAGKTTTMNIITGYMSATEGECIVNGADILAEPEKAKMQIGYLPETPPLYGDMTVKEYLDFVADIKKIKKSDKPAKIKEIMETVGITDMQNRLTKNLSKGYRQRVGLAQAMMGDPDVLILDEPTVGLDPKQITEMRNVIKKLSKKHTVILSSHILSEVSAMCDRVMIINRGNIVASDTTENLSSTLNKSSKMKVIVKSSREAVISALEGTASITELDVKTGKEDGTVEVIAGGQEGSDIREHIFFALAAKNLPILEMRSMELSLEEVFLQLTATSGGGQIDIDEGSEN